MAGMDEAQDSVKAKTKHSLQHICTYALKSDTQYNFAELTSAKISVCIKFDIMPRLEVHQIATKPVNGHSYYSK